MLVLQHAHNKISCLTSTKIQLHRMDHRVLFQRMHWCYHWWWWWWYFLLKHDSFTYWQLFSWVKDAQRMLWRNAYVLLTIWLQSTTFTCWISQTYFFSNICHVLPILIFMHLNIKSAAISERQILFNELCAVHINQCVFDNYTEIMSTFP